MDFAAINSGYDSEEKEDFNIDIDEPKPLKALPKRAEDSVAPAEAQEEEPEEEEPVQEEQEAEQEEESDPEDERPLKKKAKKQRRRGGNQFLDIEADVDDDEDDDEEGEEGFVANDDFIADRPERRGDQPRGPAAAQDEDEDDGADPDDVSHRRFDQREAARRDQAALKEAQDYKDRYGKNKYDAANAEEWAPKALLMPSDNDPSIWGVKCKVGRERDLIMSISRKAAAMAAADNGTQLQIISAFQRDSIKGHIYVESRSEQAVREAVNNLLGIYSQSEKGVFLVDIAEMPDLLRTKQRKVEVLLGGWVRIKRGKYAGDLAQIIDMSENGEEVTLKQIPRIDLTPQDQGLQTGLDGKKRKKGAGVALAFRPDQRFFNPDDISRVYGKKEVVKRAGGVQHFRGDDYREGYLEREAKLVGLVVEGVQPTLDELTRFLGESKTEDLAQLAESAKRAAKTILLPGDVVEVFEGDSKGIYGTVSSILNDVVLITPAKVLNLPGTKVEIPSRSVRKRFVTGDHVKVMNGANMDETGLVVKVRDDIVTFLSDLSMQEVTVFSKDVREAAEVGSGVNTVGQYAVYDLVQLDASTTGVIFDVERDTFRILDQTGAVRSLKPSQIGIKADSMRAVATDRDGYNIEKDDMMQEVSAGNGRDGRKGRVLHIHRSMFAFLHNREIPENGGVFVVFARNLISTAPKGNTGKPKQGSTLNPDLFGIPAGQVDGGAGRPRRDGRIERRVQVTRGAHKGYAGFIKDITGTTARVELHTNSKVITIALDFLKEQLPDGTLVILQERRGGPGGFYGARPQPGMNGSSSNTAPLGQPQGGATPFPSYGGRTPAPTYSGGRTPAGAWSGGRTPAPGTSGSSGGAWDASGGRTPSYGASGGSAAWSAQSRTPHRPTEADAWNSSSRTPRVPSGATPSWGGGATPRQATNYGGATPNPYSNTPSYGAKSSYGASARTPASAPTPAVAPTPAAAEWDNWDGPAKTPYDAATPWSAPTPGAISAPTPAAYQSYASASTPFGSAPTPFASAPTPGAHYSNTPAAGAPTPGYGLAAQTPGAGYPGTVAAQVQQEYVARTGKRMARMWAVVGLRVLFLKSGFQNGRLTEQTGIVLEKRGAFADIKLDSTDDVIEEVPLDTLQPIRPNASGEHCFLLTDEGLGTRVITQSNDGGEWMVSLPERRGTTVLDYTLLGLASPLEQ